MTTAVYDAGLAIGRRAIVVLMCLAAFAATLAVDAEAHSTNDWAYVYNPIGDGDGDHNDVTAWWPWGHEVSPPGHHVVYSNWGYTNDWSIDVFARASGRTFVTPFATRTNSGHAVQSKVVDVRPGCRSGNAADGGYRVTIEARDTATGVVLGRADLMHVASPRVGRGQGPRCVDGHRPHEWISQHVVLPGQHDRWHPRPPGVHQPASLRVLAAVRLQPGAQRDDAHRHRRGPSRRSACPLLTPVAPPVAPGVARPCDPSALRAALRPQ